MKIPFLKESSSANLPIITLLILVATLAGLVLVGYEHFMGPKTEELVKAEKNYTSKEQQLAAEMQEESYKRLQIGRAHV